MALSMHISTGEVSGEQHAARLALALRGLEPEIRLTGLGGKILARAGVELATAEAETGVMGFAEVVRHLPRLKRAFDESLKLILASRPTAVVLVDFPGFNLRLARAVKARAPEIKVLYYISPKVWAWNESRIETLRAEVDRIFCIFPFEEEYFAERGVAAEYVGNPTADAARETPPPLEARRLLGLPEHGRVVAIFPGSRDSEVARLLPVFRDAAQLLKRRQPALELVVSGAPGYNRERLERFAPLPPEFNVVEGRGLVLLSACRLVLAKSGTTTLEAALLGKPQVVAYRSSWLTAALARHLVRLKHFSLPNIVAGREIVPELFQETVTPARLAEIAEPLLADGLPRRKMLGEYSQLRRLFGDEPAAERAARAICDYLREV